MGKRHLSKSQRGRSEDTKQPRLIRSTPSAPRHSRAPSHPLSPAPKKRCKSTDLLAVNDCQNEENERVYFSAPRGRFGRSPEWPRLEC